MLPLGKVGIEQPLDVGGRMFGLDKVDVWGRHWMAAPGWTLHGPSEFSKLGEGFVWITAQLFVDPKCFGVATTNKQFNRM